MSEKRPPPVWTRDSTAYSGVRLRYQAINNGVFFDAMAYEDGTWEIRGPAIHRGANGHEASQEDACKRCLAVAYAMTDDLKTLEEP